VLPSVAEGICNALLEAMAPGLPVVATAAGGNPEVVVDKESGLLFPIGDVRALAMHLVRLRVQRPLRMQLGRRAVARVRDHFSLESMVQAYERLYSEIRPPLRHGAAGAADRKPHVRSVRYLRTR